MLLVSEQQPSRHHRDHGHPLAKLPQHHGHERHVTMGLHMAYLCAITGPFRVQRLSTTYLWLEYPVLPVPEPHHRGKPVFFP